MSNTTTPLELGAAGFVANYLKEKGISPSCASRDLEVNQSTVKRLVEGAALTTSMAVKLFTAYKISPKKLFDLESKRLTAETKALLAENA
jgi:plasmid maintenance system antidote protein VapI